MKSKTLLFIYTLTCTLLAINAFYLPGLAPVNYCKKEEVSESCKV